MNDQTETEVKLHVPDLDAVAKRLASLGAQQEGERVYEYNVRYDLPDDGLRAEGIVLRLRRDTRVRLTYKGKGSAANGVISRAEHEVEVSDFDTMDRIIRLLGYEPRMIYEKYRTTYHLDSTEVVLDEMPYGHFVEIEGTEAAIEAVIDRIELTAAPRLAASYAGLFDRVRAHLGLDFRDITFDNFARIEVPPEALYSK
jgi:adenylate cyclase class 2